MYKVIVTRGKDEPWWFFEDWKDMIVQEKTYEDLGQARKAFEAEALSLGQAYPQAYQKSTYCRAYWREGEEEYCEPCQADLQVYHGLLLMKGEEVYRGDQ